MDRYLEFILNHYILSLSLAVVTYLLIQELFESVTNKFKSISPLLAVAKMNSAETTIIDVREPHEFVKGHIENAVNIPLGKLKDQANQFSQQKDQAYLVVCQSGTRSSPGCKILQKSGFSDVYNIIGGMQAWEESKLPIKVSSKK